MILQVKSEPSDGLKRVAIPNDSLNNYPLKKRRIKYDLQNSNESSSSISSQPENVCTEPEDLRIIKNPPIKQEEVDPPVPTTFQPPDPPWFHRSPFTPYQRNHQTYPPPPLLSHHHQHLHHKPHFLLPHHTFVDTTFRPPPIIDYATPIKTHAEIPPRIKMEPEWIRRDTVISHGGSAIYRETVSRSSSCDSGVSSPTGSASSSLSASTVTPTVVNGTVRYQCSTCAKSYSTVKGLTNHVQHHCGTQAAKSFVCDHCSKVYHTSGSYKMHVRTHTLPHGCHVCGKAFSRPWLLQGHVRTHTGEKPFSCPDCHRAFADRSNLRAHSQTHSHVKKYSCGKCTKTFSRVSLLTKHEQKDCFVGN